MSSFDNLYNKIEAAIEDLATLKIVTAVGDVTISENNATVDGKTNKTRSEKYENAKAIITRIDLIDGDMETTIDKVFASDSDAAYSTIYKDHMARINEAQDIVEKNIAVLKTLINAISDILTHKPIPTPQPNTTLPATDH